MCARVDGSGEPTIATEVKTKPTWLLALALCALIRTTPALAQADAPVVRDPAGTLELVVLGSGGPGATGRAASSYLLLVQGEPRILVDAGPGSFARLGELKLSLDALGVVLLTHLHVDHAAELPGIIKARAVAAGAPIRFEVYGPGARAAHGDVPAFPSTARFMQLLFGDGGAFAYLKDFAAPVTFQVTDLPPPGSGAQAAVILARKDLTIRAIAGHHGDAPAIIYRVDTPRQSIVFSGDIDASGLPALAKISQGASLLVFDAVVLDPPGSPAVLYTLHSPPAAIGELAGRSQVKALLLSHLSPAVEQSREAVSASIASHYPGTVKFATDGLRLRP